MSVAPLFEPKILVAIACEVWRLKKYYELNKNSLPLPVCHSIRKLYELLKIYDISFIDLEGKEFDQGLNYKVLTEEKDNCLPEGKIIIKKTIKPIILLKGEVIGSGEIILAKGVGSKDGKEKKENELRD